MFRILEKSAEISRECSPIFRKLVKSLTHLALLADLCDALFTAARSEQLWNSKFLLSVWQTDLKRFEALLPNITGAWS